MNNDLSNVKVGDWIWNIKNGWGKVISIDSRSNYPISTEQESFTVDGRVYLEDAAPSAFTEPPECFNADPKPCEFVKGQRVIVSDHIPDPSSMNGHKAYFSHIESGMYFCFSSGLTEWSSDGDIEAWEYCIPAEEV